MENKKFISLLIEKYEHKLKCEENKTDLVIDMIKEISNQTLKYGSLRTFIKKDAEISNFYTRVAYIITNWASSDKLEISLKQFETIALLKNNIVSIFVVSGFRSTRHLIDLLTIDDNSKKNLPKNKVLILLALLSIDDMSDEIMDIALFQIPEVLLPLMLGWLNQRAILTKQGENNRTRLLNSGDLVKNVKIKPKYIHYISSAWMYSSYANTPNKHDIKISFNHLLKELMKKNGLVPKPIKNNLVKKPKPKLLIIHERFNSNHAVYRCYAPLIRPLKDSFEVIGIAEEKEIDSNSSKLHHKTIKIDHKKTPFDSLIKIIEDQDADIIFYPSVGMKYWTIMLSNLRLAKLQITTLGHPSTTMSDVMDYIFITKLEGDLSKIYKEKIAIYSDEIKLEAHCELPNNLPAKTRSKDGKVHIAVNSKVMKLSYRLLNICKRLNDEANYSLHFHFFPGERGMHDDAINKLIENEIPNSTIYGYMSYPKFLQLIKNCDISLAAFPFGNTNSTVDASILGVPTIAHFGPESPAQSDKQVMRYFNIDYGLVCDTDEKYFQKALELINNKRLREDISNNIIKLNSNHHLKSNLTENDSSFSDKLIKVYNDL